MLRYLGCYEKAITSYGQALTLLPHDEYACYNRACCAAKLGKVELAVESLQKAIQLNPSENWNWLPN